MKYDRDLEIKIKNGIDEKYAGFHSALVPGTKIQGVRVPLLRKIAKELAIYDDLLFNISLDSYEKISVACYYIGYTSKDINTLTKSVNFILPYVNNWAICDTFVSSLKILKKHGEPYLPVVLDYLNSNNDFTVRFAIVCLLDYYLEKVDLNMLFDKLINLQVRSYYIKMAIAWLISVAFVKNKTLTLNLLRSNKLTDEVQNKSISKIVDSYRVSLSDKEIVKKLRRA